jgi:SOS response regulatory protein OraA/RecX
MDEAQRIRDQIARQFGEHIEAASKASTAAPDEHFARVATIAAAIPADIDLSDDTDVMRALYAKGFSWAHLSDCLDDAIAKAKEKIL